MQYLGPAVMLALGLATYVCISRPKLALPIALVLSIFAATCLVIHILNQVVY